MKTVVPANIPRKKLSAEKKLVAKPPQKEKLAAKTASFSLPVDIRSRMRYEMELPR